MHLSAMRARRTCNGDVLTYRVRPEATLGAHTTARGDPDENAKSYKKRTHRCAPRVTVVDGFRAKSQTKLMWISAGRKLRVHYVKSAYFLSPRIKFWSYLS